MLDVVVAQYIVQDIFCLTLDFASGGLPLHLPVRLSRCNTVHSADAVSALGRARAEVA